MDAAMAQPDVSRIMIFGANRQMLAQSAAKNEAAEFPSRSLDAAHATVEDGQALWLYEPILPTDIKLDDADFGGLQNGAGAPLGSVLLEIGKQRTNHQKAAILWRTFLVAAAVLLLGLIVAFHVARKIIRPILALDEAIRKIGEGELGGRIGALGVAELERLAEGVNAMSEQLLQDRNTLQKRVSEATDDLMREKKMAEEANRDKSRFLAAASHDLRQPMHALGLFVDELQRKVTTAEQIRIVALIQESLSAMSNLLNSLLDISKLDAGVVIPRPHVFPIRYLLERMANDYIPMAEIKGLDLRVRMHPVFVESDDILLERILLNLINNAIAYTPEGGRILVACRRRGNRLRIEVRDNGIGIRAEDQSLIFREFLQLGNQERRRDKGLGLGLAIVSRLCKLMDNPLTLRSALGCGSVFAVDVPLAAGRDLPVSSNGPPSALVPESGAQQRLSMQDVRVLVVDDDELVLRGTGRLLASWGCQVEVANSVASARAQLERAYFDLLICDYRLADGSGLDVIEAAENANGNYVASILVSGDTAPAVLRKVDEAGRHLLHKPVSAASLRSLALFLLNGNR
jgi:signal transduction histidine kinase/CheY-like chemotaxis protein